MADTSYMDKQYEVGDLFVIGWTYYKIISETLDGWTAKEYLNDKTLFIPKRVTHLSIAA